MFGSYRYLLAHMVLLSHFWRDLSLWAGPYAVFSFFLLSGFLMAQVLGDTYGPGVRGSGRFLANRALRIYPPYLCVLALSLVTSAAIPRAAAASNLVMRWPRDWVEWLHNLGIFGLNGAKVRLVPPAWSLDLELVFYVLMGVGLARNRLIVLAWLALSLVYAAYAWGSGLEFTARYATLLSASLPFALGAAIQHHRDWLARLTTGRVHVPLAVTLYVANAALTWVHRDPFGTGFYLSLLATGYVVVALMQVRRRDLPGWAARTDRILGDLSYPVFLCHFPIAAWAIHFGLTPARGPLTLVVAALGSSAFAWLVHSALENPVGRVRDRVRGRASDAALSAH
jgi:peptidoglycan/LPS O-acetylase OafA/YrhL